MQNLSEAVIQGNKASCNELVLSGGEPTTQPDKIISLINLAENLNYKKYIIQTNGVGLAHNYKLVNFLDRLSKVKEVCISFSVHGFNAEIHNTMSCNSAAFKTLQVALKNISQTNCRIYTNTVITSLNIDTLENIVKLIIPLKPSLMQFSMLHLNKPSKLFVSLVDSANAVRKLGDTIDLEILKTEGIPFCLLHGMEKCVGEAYWPNTLDIYNRKNNYISDFKQIDFGMRKKLPVCGSCIFNSICMGVWSEHYNEFSSLGIHPVC